MLAPSSLCKSSGMPEPRMKVCYEYKDAGMGDLLENVMFTCRRPTLTPRTRDVFSISTISIMHQYRVSPAWSLSLLKAL